MARNPPQQMSDNAHGAMAQVARVEDFRREEEDEREGRVEEGEAEAEENQEERGGGELANPYRPLGLQAAPPTDDRMVLSQEERNLAVNIKQAIANAKDVDPVSDFMCAQLALIDGDNTEAAVERVYHLQSFREEYSILDSAADGARRLVAFIELTPGFHLCFANDKAMGHTVIVFDNTKFSGKQICSEETLQTWLGSVYYTCTSFCPDFEAIRRGAIIVLECEGYDWRMHGEFKNIKRVWTEIASIYPVSFQKVKYFNSGTMMNVVVSMLRPFLPKYLRGKVEIGCQFDQRLDKVYLVPNMEQANLRILSRMEETLRRRYKNERTFRL